MVQNIRLKTNYTSALAVKFKQKKFFKDKFNSVYTIQASRKELWKKNRTLSPFEELKPHMLKFRVTHILLRYLSLFQYKKVFNTTHSYKLLLYAHIANKLLISHRAHRRVFPHSRRKMVPRRGNKRLMSR